MDTLLEAIDVCDVDGFCYGNYTDEEAGTGCTVIVAPEGATGGVDVRGGAPASRETDLLRPENTVDKVHAVCLSGGSAFGLEAASGVARELESRGIGLPVGPTQVPIVCSSCIFDLAFGNPTVRPDIEAGIAAVREALDHTPTKLEQGNVGAGTGATVGKLMGPATCMKAGLGAAAVALGPIKVGAVVSVNACGNVVDPFTGEWVAGMRAAADSDQIVDMELAAFAAAGSMQMPLDRTNTTISCIVTNVELTKAQATKGLPDGCRRLRTRHPSHTHHQRRRHHLHPRQRQTGSPGKRRRSLGPVGHARRKGFANRHRKRSQNRQNLPRHPRRREVN